MNQSRRSLFSQFADAWRGCCFGFCSQRNIKIQLAAAALSCAAAWYFDFTVGEWVMLLLTIGLVLTAELINTAIECLAKAITTEQNPWIKTSLDTAAGAVLAAACCSVVVGILLFGPRLWLLLMTG